jgi:vitamin B12/bleomycin/antimicrobial peptide transport system ATP-binding/permease protein
MDTPDAVDRQPVGLTFLRLAGGFWTGRHARRAWLWTLAVAVCLCGQILTQIGMNMWNRVFFDALEKKDAGAVMSAFLALPLLVLAIAVTVSALVITRMSLQMRWREWVTRRLAGWWLADQRYYRMGFTAPEQSAPEYRIAEDVRLSVEPMVEFAIGLIGAAISAATFAAILWKVAGSAGITVAGQVYVIPAYMAFAAVGYATIASTAALFAGRPLIGRVAAKNEAEARFRSEMTRLRENAESIALIRGDKDELGSLLGSYDVIVKNWMRVIRQNGVIALVLNTNGALFPIVPLLLITPKYLSGELSLGAVMQVVAAFSAVQGALIWFVDNSVKLVDWYASARRIVELTDALDDIDVGTVMEDETHITMGQSDDGAIHIERLSVADSAGRAVINDASIRIERGEKVMLTGESGSGKSILIRALAGLWPWGSGVIRLPRDVTIAFVPQRPYLPLGTLRDSVTYPNGADVADDTIVQAMRRCGLSYLVKRLDEEDRWDQMLSGGERQRVAFVRLLIHKPQIIIMDESTSALDEDSQYSLLSLLLEDLAGSTVISVAHRSGVEEFHNRKIKLEKRAAGARMTQSRLPTTLWHLIGEAN